MGAENPRRRIREVLVETAAAGGSRLVPSVSKIYIPLSTAQRYFVGADTVHAWAFKADPEIFGQFLIEAVSLSLVGAFIGAGLGYGRSVGCAGSR